MVVVIIHIFENRKDCLIKELILLLYHYVTKARVKFSGSCLRKEKATYIVYEISKNYNISSYLTLENCLSGAVSLTKHVDTDQQKYSGYGIGFDRIGEFSFGNGFGRNEIIFGADMGSYVHANNKNKKYFSPW